MDFSLSSKHKKEVEQRRREAKRKLEEQKRQEHAQAEMAETYEQRALERLRAQEEERRRRDEEALANDGVHWRAQFKPWPSDRTDDKLMLPPSALEHLEQQGALEKGLLTFSVSIPGGFTRTHAGVAEFTAEEGTVGLPPRVALCLTKGAGLQSLERMGFVEVRYVRLSRYAKCSARLQPRGHGFHLEGSQTVNIDLEHVLMESLRGHTALSEGDWLGIRSSGVTYELVVKELSPDSRLCLVDTELAVDILPSEQTEVEQKEEEMRKAREQAAIQAAREREEARVLHARRKAAALGAEPATGLEVLQLMIRLPEGGRLQRRFTKTTVLREVFDWVESDPSTRVEPDQFKLVQRHPPREFSSSDAQQSLAALGFQRQEVLFLHRFDAAEVDPTHLLTSAEGALEPIAESGARSIALPPLEPEANAHAEGTAAAWASAEERAHEALDRRVDGHSLTPTSQMAAEPTLAELSGQELVDVFEQLKAMGMGPEEAARASKRFAPQLRELAAMGFHDWVAAVPLLEKYNGRLVRVVNLLSEGASETLASPAGAPEAAASPITGAVPSPMPASAPAKLGAGLPKEQVAAEFKKLIAGGMAPNEAAVKAIEIVKESSAGG